MKKAWKPLVYAFVYLRWSKLNFNTLFVSHKDLKKPFDKAWRDYENKL